MVVHSCYSSYKGGIVRRIMVLVQLSAKRETLPEK
jgi:hypothetical protein